MTKDPAVLFYTADFLAGTIFMRNEQVGKYIKLLCMQHQQGHLKEEDMLEMCGTYDERIFSKFSKDEDGLYYNERMEEEILKRKKYSESRSANRKATKNKDMSNDKQNTSKTYVAHMENENINVIIFEYWNNKNIIRHRELTEDISKAIDKALKLYKEQEIKTYIDRYAKVIGDKDYFWHYKWSLKDFLSRKDGISAFTDEGSKWVNYCDSKKGVASGNDNKNTVGEPTAQKYGRYC